MNTKNDNLNEDLILKQAYEKIAPADSWESLRQRINNRLAESQLNSTQYTNPGNLRFWKSLSFAMAACFFVTAGILIYTIGLNQGANRTSPYNMSTYSNRLVTHDDISNLTDAFSQVQQLFGDQSRWIVIGSDNESQVGLTDNPQRDGNPQKLVVVRLALSSDSQETQRQYYDVVTYADQKTKLYLPLVNETALTIDLKPTVRGDGTIGIEIAADTGSGSQSKSKSAIASESYTPLLNMNVNGEWIKIDGVGRQTSADGKMML